MVDLKNKCLIDSATGLKSDGGVIKLLSYGSISSVDDSDFAKLLEQFPDLTRPGVQREKNIPNRTEHVIETTGMPIPAKARRLTPEKLKAAKKEFEELMRRGEARPSKSPYASAIHMAPGAGRFSNLRRFSTAK